MKNKTAAPVALDPIAALTSIVATLAAKVDALTTPAPIASAAALAPAPRVSVGLASRPAPAPAPAAYALPKRTWAVEAFNAADPATSRSGNPMVLVVATSAKGRPFPLSIPADAVLALVTTHRDAAQRAAQHAIAAALGRS